MTNSTSKDVVRGTLTQWLSGLSLVPTIMGILGWVHSQGEAVLLAVPGLREALWGGLIALGPICLVCLNLPWMLARLSSNKFKALHPRLTKIAHQGDVREVDKYWTKKQLTKLSIPCPEIKETYPLVDKEWKIFVMKIAPLAECGEIQEAQRLLRPL